MSITKTDQTITGIPDAYDVAWKLDVARLDGIVKPAQNVRASSILRAYVGNSQTPVPNMEITVALGPELLAEMSSQEKLAGKTFFAALERVVVARVADFEGIDHDSSDVMQ